MQTTSTNNQPAKALRRESAAAGFLPVIDASSSVPAVRQLYLQLRDGIVSGLLQPDHRLPSTRLASLEWSLSRGLVTEVYEMLIAEGYAVGRHGSGTYIASGLPAMLIGSDKARGITRTTKRRGISVAAMRAMQTDLAPPPQVAFSTGRVVHDARTAGLLKRLTYRHIDYATDTYRDPQGEVSLRQAIAAHLAASRGVRCEPDQIFITSGTQQALDFIIRVLVSPDETVMVEDPCYPPARLAFVLNGAQVTGLPVDDEGLITGNLAAYDGKAPAAIYVTPSHQYPSGSALPLARRLELLAFAEERGSWIIEDDYDSEFRYDGHPIASLQGLDTTRRVIYAGTFSKALLPSIRVGYLIVPSDLVPVCRAIRPIMDRFPAPLHQHVVADFLNEGYFASHLRRLRESYRASRNNLAMLLKERLSDHLIAPLPEQGIHFTVKSTGTWHDDCALADAAMKGGVVVIPVSPMHIFTAAEPRLLLGFSGLKPKEAEIATARLARVFDSVTKHKAR
ncbi:MocR-like pyridoxine biosynthesis transcription factor PdxR [Pseudochrobactrum kiredjianiae]|uniref:PLP-dependent aminotransferase family protein n=1 Tax=Pseudochrobactrum kiredjianiae TaxID=386305 RepID=A0ABW3V4G6_9HYPH|nr:PLP-dependent aminotransferase family protein [Pseudochrobactrum kiredjianiae]MDM7850876.1 PLP-dependent aminotransferase family protein [Pseudochrobactrum kiredjianiae]